MLAITASDTPPWRLVVSGASFQNRVFEGEDLFEALLALRTELEADGCLLLCAGARIDVFPSGMSRSMGGARKAHIVPLNGPATETIDILDEAEPSLVGTIQRQEEFHDNWIRSLKKRKQAR